MCFVFGSFFFFNYSQHVFQMKLVIELIQLASLLSKSPQNKNI